VSLEAALAGRRAWIVGGTVRDELLGRQVADVDVAVEGDPEPVARALADATRGAVFALSEAFGAWRVIDRAGDRVLDLSPLQGETIEEDLSRRDFTVNAMARPLEGGELLDPHGGRDDLASGTLRVLGAGAYRSDPLRPLRLARFAAELGFEPDEETARLTRAAAPSVVQAAPERVFAELKRLVSADGALDGLALADRLGLLRAVLPELSDLHDVEQSHYHHLDVYGHTLEVLREQIALEGRLGEVFGDELAPRVAEVLAEPFGDELTRAQALRLGALVHDIGKPATRGVRPDGRVTFMGHDRTGEEMVRRLGRRLRASEKLTRFLEALTRHHLVVGFLVHERPLSRRQVFRYLQRTAPVEVELIVLTCADRRATRGRNAEAAIAAHLALARELMAEALEWRASGPPKPPLRGDELARELDMQPGPELGRLMGALQEAAFAGEATTREQAVELARRLRQNSQS
jgi:poly(A) polymerase